MKISPNVARLLIFSTNIDSAKDGDTLISMMTGEKRITRWRMDYDKQMGALLVMLCWGVTPDEIQTTIRARGFQCDLLDQ